MRNAILSMILTLICFSTNADIHSFILEKKDSEKLSITTKDLEAMPVKVISTSTNFTDKSEFAGVSFRILVEKFKINGDTIRAFAWDDYSYSIPVKELLKYDVILAYKKNGKYMPTSDLGPYAIIYPRDENPELNSLDVNARTVWQIKRIKVN